MQEIPKTQNVRVELRGLFEGPAVFHAWMPIDLSDFRAPAEIFPGVDLPPEVARAVKKRQIEFLAGRVCALAALDAAGHLLPAGSAQIPRNDDRSPRFPDGLVGSITHTYGHAAACVARSPEILALGLDSEGVLSAKTATNVTRTIVSDDELRLVGDQLEVLTLVFSAKESLYKMLRPLVGSFFGFHDAAIHAIRPMNTAQGEFELKIKRQLGPFEIGQIFRGRYMHEGTLIHTGMQLKST